MLDAMFLGILQNQPIYLGYIPHKDLHLQTCRHFIQNVKGKPTSLTFLDCPDPVSLGGGAVRFRGGRSKMTLATQQAKVPRHSSPPRAGRQTILHAGVARRAPPGIWQNAPATNTGNAFKSASQYYLESGVGCLDTFLRHYRRAARILEMFWIPGGVTTPTPQSPQTPLCHRHRRCGHIVRLCAAVAVYRPRRRHLRGLLGWSVIGG